MHGGGVDVLDERAVAVGNVAEDIRLEVVSYAGNFEVAFVALIADANPVNDIIGVKICSLSLRIERQRNGTGKRFRRAIGRGIVGRDRRHGVVNVFQAVFDFVSH